MSKKKIEFMVTQKGALGLDQNLGDDPTYRLPIEIVGDDTNFNEIVSCIDGIYYCNSEGWVPMTGINLTSFELVGIKNKDTINELNFAINKIGDVALRNLFEFGKVMWSAIEMTKPISIDS